jgi:S-adenosylmethionine:tRNA ribosyltransferase-isomerase
MSDVEAIDLADYDFVLSPERIAQYATTDREAARLLALDRSTGVRTHGGIGDLTRWLRAGDLLVVNATRVVSARLRGAKASGGRVEALLLGRAEGPGRWRALVKSSGRQRAGTTLRLGAGERAFDATIEAIGTDGEVVLALDPTLDPYAAGETPLPPYIVREDADPRDVERYQTVYAREPGAIAAPTAGLHLTERLLAALDAQGVERAEVVLHVGAGTFRPLRESDLAADRLHAERYELPDATAAAIERTRARGGRVCAVGTTTTRVLESRAIGSGRVRAGRGETELFVRPGFEFRVVDALLTNFHLPRSSLLLLVAAFAGRERILGAYADAIAAGYRFYSYGDAMWIA